MKMFYDWNMTEINPSLTNARQRLSNMTITELIETLDQLSDKTESPLLVATSIRLAHVAAALTCLQDALFYVRMYKSLDPTGEGEKRRQQLIDDSEFIIDLINKGGMYP